MGLFGKKKDQKPLAFQSEPEQQLVPPDVKPYQYMYLHDGQWFINPNYDPNAKKPEPVMVYGLDDDEKEDEEEDEE